MKVIYFNLEVILNDFQENKSINLKNRRKNSNKVEL